MPTIGAKLQSLARPALVGCFLLAPVAVVSLVLAARLDASLAKCIPVWSDEVHYWNEIACFKHAEFAGGYCVADERIAKIKQCHFGAHGPGFPVVYGCMAKLLGWRQASGPFFNLIALFLCSIVWLRACRPDVPRLLGAVLLAATFWPCLLYLPSTMQESLHCAIAFLLAGLAHARINGQGNGPLSLWPFVIAVVLVSMIRITWLLVLIPWACVTWSGLPWRMRVYHLAVIACAIPALGWLWTSMCSPYPNFMSAWIEVARTSPSQAAWDMLARTSIAVQVFFLPGGGSAALEVMQRYVVVGLVSGCAALTLWPKNPDRRPYLFASLNLAVTAILILTLYHVHAWRDYRVMAPHLLLSLLILLSGNAYRWALGVGALHLLLLPSFLANFTEIHRDRFAANPARLGIFRELIGEYVRYKPTATSAWVNTLFIPSDSADYTMLGLDPGIGFSFVSNQLPLNLPLKSRYLLLSPLEGQALSGRMNLRFLTEVEGKHLYLNLDCER
jgi:hypothetical protein